MRRPQVARAEIAKARTLTESCAAARRALPATRAGQDANGNVIAKQPSAADVAAVAGVSIGAIVGGILVIVTLLAARAWYVLKQDASKPVARRVGGGRSPAVEGRFAAASPVGRDGR